MSATRASALVVLMTWSAAVAPGVLAQSPGSSSSASGRPPYRIVALTTSQLTHQVEFGVLAAGTLLFAALLDVTLTPALATLLERGRAGVA